MKRAFSLTCLMVFTSLWVAMAQDSVEETPADPGLDKIVMVSGEVKMGKVTGMSDDEVQFVHDKETLTYTFPKSKISKIEFGASGRIEVYNQVQTASTVSPNLSDHHNKIAILPFAYVRDGRQLMNDINETKLQQEFFNLMQGHVGSLNIQAPQTTNALLAKNGVTDETFNNYMIPEIANMLGVEYVVRGILTVNEQGSTTYTSNYSTYESKSKGKSTGYSGTSSSSTLQFNTIVDMTVYNDHGDALFAQTKESFWPTEDAYQQTFPYLLKRMPIYQK